MIPEKHIKQVSRLHPAARKSVYEKIAQDHGPRWSEMFKWLVERLERRRSNRMPRSDRGHQRAGQF